MTLDERLDYEIEREFYRLRDEGLLLQTTAADGGAVWSMTLRGLREFDCPVPRTDSGS